jgi:hypothetical protein
MKPHPQSEYSNEKPPYLDVKWIYKNSNNTQIYNTLLRYGLKPKVVKL